MTAATGVIPISSDEVTRQRDTAWNSVKDKCNELSEPESGKNMKFFQPTLHCDSIIKTICSEYNQQAVSLREIYKEKPTKISSYLQAGFVFFPGNTTIDSFTILVPLRVSGKIELGDETVDENHYYHVLSKTLLILRTGSRLEAITISNIH